MERKKRVGIVKLVIVVKWLSAVGAAGHRPKASSGAR